METTICAFRPIYLDKTDEIVKTIDSDSAVSKYAVLTTKTFKVKTSNGSEENIKIELGDHSAFPIEYSEGRAPARDDEIALSAINADEMSKKVGDVITLVIEGKEKNLTVTGIYSDVTNGGKTAKAVFTDNSANVMWTIVCVELSDKSLVDSKVSGYSDKFDFAKTSDIDEFVSQTLGSTISSVENSFLRRSCRCADYYGTGYTVVYENACCKGQIFHCRNESARFYKLGY